MAESASDLTITGLRNRNCQVPPNEPNVWKTDLILLALLPISIKISSLALKIEFNENKLSSVAEKRRRSPIGSSQYDLQQMFESFRP